MTAAHSSGPLRPVPASCVGIVDCGGARVSAHVRGPATVLVVEGDIDMCNSDQVGAAIRRLGPPATSLVVDLRAIDFIGVSGFRELLAFSDECDRAHVAWHLVAGEALRPLLRVFADHGLPLVDSTGQVSSSA